MPKCRSIIAVVGSGRSGTHLLGNLINTSRKITASIEDDDLFPLITKAATENNRELAPKIARKLERRLKKCKTELYLEKSHPLMWLADDSSLARLPVKYIGIVRDPYATVASMLRHEGVRKWCEDWEKLPHPNIFLGISQDNIDEYRRMTIVQKCAIRWISHALELERLSYAFPREQYLQLNYEDVLNKPEQSIDKIEGFIGVNDIDKKFKMNKESLSKWKNDLSPDQINQIKGVLADYYKGKLYP